MLLAGREGKCLSLAVSLTEEGKLVQWLGRKKPAACNSWKLWFYSCSMALASVCLVFCLDWKLLGDQGSVCLPAQLCLRSWRLNAPVLKAGSPLCCTLHHLLWADGAEHIFLQDVPDKRSYRSWLLGNGKCKPWVFKWLESRCHLDRQRCLPMRLRSCGTGPASEDG